MSKMQKNTLLILKNEIDNYIDFKQHHNSPKEFLQYGAYFIIVSLTTELLGLSFLIKNNIAF
jgi:hypothetical protein